MPLYHVHFATDADEPIPSAGQLPSVEADDPVKAVEPGDVVAVSATNLSGVYLSDDEDALRLMRRLRRQSPVATVGYSILIYRADFSWRSR